MDRLEDINEYLETDIKKDKNAMEKMIKIFQEEKNFPIICLNGLKEMNEYLGTDIIGSKNDVKEIIRILLKYSNKNPIQLIKRVEIKESKIHGKGVFALTNIKEGTVMTFYPSHGIIIDDGVMIDNLEDKSFIKNVTQNKYYRKYGVSDYSSLFGHNLNIIGNPTEIGNAMLLGHMINDSVGNVFKNNENDTDLKKMRNVIASYYIKTVSNSNCRFAYNMKYPLISVVATRDIQEGEELLIAYGISYWYDEHFGTSNKHDFKYSKLLSRIIDPNLSKYICKYNEKFSPEIFNYVITSREIPIYDLRSD
jgi:SET domain-containing protein